jgi:hypothetical protein
VKNIEILPFTGLQIIYSGVEIEEASLRSEGRILLTPRIRRGADVSISLAAEFETGSQVNLYVSLTGSFDQQLSQADQDMEWEGSALSLSFDTNLFAEHEVFTWEIRISQEENFLLARLWFTTSTSYAQQAPDYMQDQYSFENGGQLWTRNGLEADGFGWYADEDDEDGIEDMELPIGEDIFLVIGGLEGFEVKNGMSKAGMSVTVIKQEDGETVYYEQDILSEDEEGFDPEEVGAFTLSLPEEIEIPGKTYLLLVEIWDKQGKGQVYLQTPFQFS